MKQRLYIITGPKQEIEAWQYASSLANLAIVLENGRYAVSAIEEVPEDSVLEIKAFHQVAHEWPKFERVVERLSMPAR